jgi:phytoene dehydrogenase-like protein
MRQMKQDQTMADVAVVGGGLAGLAAATILARHGRAVRLFEKGQRPGGRAATQVKQGFHFNLGPHALYRKGAAARLLQQLGVRFHGGVPPLKGNYALYAGRVEALPSGLLSILRSPFLSQAAKWELLRVYTAVTLARPQQWTHHSLEEWWARDATSPEALAFLRGLFRLWTYSADSARLSAGAALAQAQLALAGNVLYVDGGWQTLVDGLRAQAEAAGVVIHTGSRVERVEHDGRVRAVTLANGHSQAVSQVILATGPAEAAALVPHSDGLPLQNWADEAVPVQVASLDLGLRRLPRPEVQFAVGLDEPLYFSAHSAYAKLVDDKEVLVHAVKYLPAGRLTDARRDQEELEAMMDRLQPGWREEVISERYMPYLTVAHSFPQAAQGGLSGRPGPAVAGIDGLYVAGDWVGDQGLLLDAAVASAERAARLALAVTPLAGPRPSPVSGALAPVST